MGFDLKMCEFATYAMYNAHKRTTMSDIEEIAEVVRIHLGRDITMPFSAHYKVTGAKMALPDMWKKRYKIIAYLGPEQCKNCHHIMLLWKRLMESCEEKYPDLGFLFIAHTDDYKQIEDVLYKVGISHPVMYDYDNTFIKDNRMPDNDDFHTCLLDEADTILFVGTPVKNPKIWKECESVIQFNNLNFDYEGQKKKLKY